MSSGVRAGLLLIAGVLAVLPSARAQEVESGDIRVRKLPGLPVGASHGYHEYAFLVTNHSPDEAHEVRLEMPEVSHTQFGTHVLRRIAHSATVGPASTVRLTLHQPPLPLAGNGVRVFVDGRELDDRIALAFVHPDEGYAVRRGSGAAAANAAALRVLVSQRVRAEALPPSSDPQQYLRAVTAPDAWSGDWLAYSGYDGVVLGARELDEAGAAVRDALWRYVETGGALLVAGPSQGGLASPAAFGRELERLGTVKEHGLTVAYAGFGVCLLSPVRLDELSPAQLDRVTEAWRASREPWSIVRNAAAARQLFSVVPDVRVPVRGIFLVVVAFTILVGPVNLMVLRRWRRRIWMLWTVPVASLVAAVVVFFYALASEGLNEVQRSVSLTLLDERSRRAVTLAWTGFYSTLTPSGGLTFARHTEVSPIVAWSYAGTGTGARTLDWTHGQHLASGWVNARLPAYFVVRKSELKRERLRVRSAGGGALEVTNGLGADVEALHVAAADGRVYTAAGRLAAGASGPLRPSAETAAGHPFSPRQLFRGDLPSRLLRLEQEPAAFLRPSTYVAVLAGDPFLDEGIRGFRDAQQRAVAFGFLAGEEGP